MKSSCRSGRSRPRRRRGAWALLLVACTVLASGCGDMFSRSLREGVLAFASGSVATGATTAALSDLLINTLGDAVRSFGGGTTSSSGG